MAQATFPPVEDVARFSLIYTSDDGVALVDCMNELYAHKDGGWSVGDMQATAEDIRAAWAAEVAPLVQTGYSLQEIRYKNLDNPLNPTGVFSFVTVAGTNVNEPIPFTSSATVRFTTSGLFPTSCYIRHGGIVESQVDGQHLLVAQQGLIRDAWQEVSVAIHAPVDVEHVCIQVYQPDPVGNLIYKDEGTREDVTDTLVRRRLGTAVSRKK